MLFCGGDYSSVPDVFFSVPVDVMQKPVQDGGRKCQGSLLRNHFFSHRSGTSTVKSRPLVFNSRLGLTEATKTGRTASLQLYRKYAHKMESLATLTI